MRRYKYGLKFQDGSYGSIRFDTRAETLKFIEHLLIQYPKELVYLVTYTEVITDIQVIVNPKRRGNHLKIV